MTTALDRPVHGPASEPDSSEAAEVLASMNQAADVSKQHVARRGPRRELDELVWSKQSDDDKEK